MIRWLLLTRNVPKTELNFKIFYVIIDYRREKKLIRFLFCLKKKTPKSEILHIIFNKLEQLEDESLNLRWNSMKNKKKADLIKFFNDLP